MSLAQPPSPVPYRERGVGLHPDERGISWGANLHEPCMHIGKEQLHRQQSCYQCTSATSHQTASQHRGEGHWASVLHAT